MRILVIGSGGREHALAWRCAREGHEVWAAPGSDGIAAVARCVPVAVDDAAQLAALARREAMDLVIVGPEGPLVGGVADVLRAAGVATLGPSAAAARLEGSKADAKSFMVRHGIPTARHAEVAALDEALAAVHAFDAPPVVKADGLAAGKGVTVAETFEEAEAAVRGCLAEGIFGAAGARVVLEERMPGEEASVFVLTDGTSYVTFAAAQDHKRLCDGDRGPNTGGMGAYVPAPVVDADVARRVEREIIVPTLEGLRAEGRPFVGVLFLGLMIHEGAPRLIEYNCRFGDPEAQPLVVGAIDDWAPLLRAAAVGELTTGALASRPAATVVLAAAGYPGTPRRGDVIAGLGAAAASEEVVVFHAGTQARGADWLTAGGRVLGVCATAATLAQAIARADAAADLITFPGRQRRRDIGARALARG